MVIFRLKFHPILSNIPGNSRYSPEVSAFIFAEIPENQMRAKNRKDESTQSKTKRNRDKQFENLRAVDGKKRGLVCVPPQIGPPLLSSRKFRINLNSTGAAPNGTA